MASQPAGYHGPDSQPGPNPIPRSSSSCLSLMERLQKQAPDAHFVKVFSNAWAAPSWSIPRSQAAPTMFICGNDLGAKADVRTVRRPRAPLNRFVCCGVFRGSARTAGSTPSSFCASLRRAQRTARRGTAGWLGWRRGFPLAALGKLCGFGGQPLAFCARLGGQLCLEHHHPRAEPVIAGRQDLHRK